MYQPSHFEETRHDVLVQLMRQYPLALLIHSGTDGLAADPVPLIHDPDGGPHGCLRGHVARANPLWQRTLAEPDVLVVFQGPQAYVSPNWYPAKAEHGKVVPTWNYCLVQARGKIRIVEDADWLLRLVSRLTERHESTMQRPWAVSDAPPGYIAQMLGAIVGLELPIDQLVGKWKVSQNRSAADRAGVADGLAATTDPDDVAMARQVRAPGS